MSDTPTPTTPDYGEPLRAAFGNAVRDRNGQLTNLEWSLRDRIIACVNACAGMADPAKEIARFKSCSDELDSILSVIPEDEPCHHAETGEMVTDYILDLQKEVGRVHALYFNTSQQLEAMREAIREAHEAIKASPYPDQQALAKLQPFITP